MDLQFPKLKGKRVLLRPLNPNDYKNLFHWHFTPENSHMWWTDRQILSYEDFLSDLQNKMRRFIHTLFIIESIDDKSTLGMVYFYNANFIDRLVYICIYLDPQFTAQKIGQAAGYLACEYYFKTFGVRKIYAEVFEFNEPSLKITARNGFKEEAKLKEHRWFDDRYWDLHILSLSSDDFKKLPASTAD